MSAPPMSNNAANIPSTSTPIAIAARSSDLTNYGSSSILSTGPPSTGTPPSSNFKFPSVIEDKKNRRTSLQVLLPKLPSTDSLSNSPGPASPELKAEVNGLSNWNDNSPKVEGGITSDKSFESKLARKESYKAQRKNYRREKKRVASELLNSLQDPAVIVLADWLKVRGTLKSWTKLWCVLKPGLLLLYKSPKTKSSHWVGTILLTSCQVIERPSKKDGFCFKLFHPLEQSIWAPRGPDKETIGAVVQPLPTAYLIFRAPSQAAGKCWLDALELSLRCSALLLRSVSGNTKPEIDTLTGQSSHETQWSEADYEKHFNEHGTLQDQITFLKKYLPKTPDKHYNMRSLSPLDNFRNTPRSPCPSPTPIFQQLYCALSHWERIMSESPELLCKNRFTMIKTAGTTQSHKTINKTFSTGDDDDDNDEDDDYDTDYDTSNDNSPFHEIRKSNSMLHVYHDGGDKFEMQRRKSSPVINVNEMAEGEGKVFRKCQFKSKNLIKIKIYDEDTNLDVDNQTDGGTLVLSGPESDSESDVLEIMEADEFPETNYIHCPEEDTFGGVGEQVEELAEEHKSLIWFLVKQVRPGMDLSKVVLPTFILEPRSFLDKLSDSYYHADILSKAVLEDDPFTRMKTVVKWYLSGFYKKPKGLKKPYNPILGETFRCFWEHENGSRTYYLAEQVSHHPPISAFYVTNRQDGFCISCSILAKSKFYGNSTSAILDGIATLTLLPRGESYSVTVPYAHCKGILMGTLSMELGGKVSIECENTGYRAEIEFKLKPFLGGTEATNVISGRLKLGKETLATLHGHWDSEIKIKDSRTAQEEIFFAANNEIKAKRLKRFTVPIEAQSTTDSERLWQHVSAAIYRDDQVAATEEKTALEEAQRNSVKERKALCIEWISSHFQQDIVTGQWHYKYADLRPWDLRNDLRQYESNYRIVTKTKHHAPMVRTASIVSSEPLTLLQTDSRSSLAVLKNTKRVLSSRKLSQSQTSTPDPNEHNSDSSRSDGIITGHSSRILDALANINKKLDENTKKISTLQLKMDRMTFEPKRGDEHRFMSLNHRTIMYIGIGLLIHLIATWILTRK